MALPLETPRRAARSSRWAPGGEAIADYRSNGMTLGEHPLALLRDGLDPELLRSADLERVADGATVEVAGMVVARQRPETAKGIVFMLLEDERGTVNLIVPPPVYERHRAEVRASPLVRARGRLERREGTTNVVVAEVRRAGAHRADTAAGSEPDSRGLRQGEADRPRLRSPPPRRRPATHGRPRRPQLRPSRSLILFLCSNGAKATRTFHIPRATRADAPATIAFVFGNCQNAICELVRV